MACILKVMVVENTIPLEQYLQTAFPGLDKEFRDGRLVDRPMPDYLHGRVQGVLFGLFFALRRQLLLFPCVETRLLLPGRRSLIPDVTVFQGTEPPRVPDSPPLVAIEVRSADDRLVDIQLKLEEYRDWGVPHVWLVDPRQRSLYVFDRRLQEVQSLEIAELGVRFGPEEIFD